MKMEEVERLKGPFETREVLAAARRNRARGRDLSHTFAVSDNRVLCGNVFADHLADRCAADTTAEPTCRRCWELDPRFDANYGISNEFRNRVKSASQCIGCGGPSPCDCNEAGE